MRELALEDSVISFIYHLVIGIILVSFINQGLGQGILFFIPVFLYTAVSTLPVDISQSKIINLVVSSSTFLGVLIGGGFYQNAHPIVYLALLGFIIGALSFTVFRHSIPQGSKGKPLLFTIGVILYAIVIFLL